MHCFTYKKFRITVYQTSELGRPWAFIASRIKDGGILPLDRRYDSREQAEEYARRYVNWLTAAMLEDLRGARFDRVNREQSK